MNGIQTSSMPQQKRAGRQLHTDGATLAQEGTKAHLDDMVPQEGDARSPQVRSEPASTIMQALSQLESVFALAHKAWSALSDPPMWVCVSAYASNDAPQACRATASRDAAARPELTKRMRFDKGHLQPLPRFSPAAMRVRHVLTCCWILLSTFAGDPARMTQACRACAGTAPASTARAATAGSQRRAGSGPACCRP